MRAQLHCLSFIMLQELAIVLLQECLQLLVWLYCTFTVRIAAWSMRLQRSSRGSSMCLEAMWCLPSHESETSLVVIDRNAYWEQQHAIYGMTVWLAQPTVLAVMRLCLARCCPAVLSLRSSHGGHVQPLSQKGTSSTALHFGIG